MDDVHEHNFILIHLVIVISYCCDREMGDVHEHNLHFDTFGNCKILQFFNCKVFFWDFASRYVEIAPLQFLRQT